MNVSDLIRFVRERGPLPLDAWAASALLAIGLGACLLLLARRIPPRARPHLAWLPLIMTGLSFALWISLIHQSQAELLERTLTIEPPVGDSLEVTRRVARVIALLHPGGWVYLLVWPLTAAACLRLAIDPERHEQRGPVWVFGATAASLLASPAMAGASLGVMLFAQIREARSFWEPDLETFGALAQRTQGARPFVIGIALLGGLIAAALALRGSGERSRGGFLRSRTALLGACLLLAGGMAAFGASRPYAVDAPYPLRLAHPFWGYLPSHDHRLPQPAASSCVGRDDLRLSLRYEGNWLRNGYDQELSPVAFGEALTSFRRIGVDSDPERSSPDLPPLLFANPHRPVGPLLPYLREARRQGYEEVDWAGIRLEPVERRTLPGRVHARQCIARTRIERVLAEPGTRTVGELLERPEAPTSRRPAPTRPP